MSARCVTRAEQITELETELATLKTARTSALTGGSQAMLGDMSISGISSVEIGKRIAQIERDLQRLRRGGRNIIVDMSARADGVLA